ncbi:hypothetical protein C1S70_27250 (plasmid) [Azospirillum argentinense]|uniref:Uncharacterized protein n=1 Tax=Azospirillum argentinense TaxID=2970906 RepID=A0A2K1FTA2_9PROT|nr:hypothetical protein C1S70_27250 [Azospirillum argentinense]
MRPPRNLPMCRMCRMCRDAPISRMRTWPPPPRWSPGPLLRRRCGCGAWGRRLGRNVGAGPRGGRRRRGGRGRRRCLDQPRSRSGAGRGTRNADGCRRPRPVGPRPHARAGGEGSANPAGARCRRRSCA